MSFNNSNFKTDYEDIPRIWKSEKIPEYVTIKKLLKDTFEKDRTIFLKNNMSEDDLKNQFLITLRPELENKILWSALLKVCKNILNQIVLNLKNNNDNL